MLRYPHSWINLYSLVLPCLIKDIERLLSYLKERDVVFQTQKPAVFIDRDGTLNIDHGYVCEIDNFHFIEGVIDALGTLKKMGFLLIVVTNQSGIAREKFSEEQFTKLTEWMDWSLADRGVDLDAIYYCPHHLEGKDSLYRQQCDCRKPEPGMLLAAQAELNIDMSMSYMVGDKRDDILAGKAAKVGTCVLVRTGNPISVEDTLCADWVLDSLVDLPAKIKSTR